MQAHKFSCSIRFIRIWILAILLSLGSIQHAFGEELNAFLRTYCMDCHGEEKQKGDRRFDKLILSSDDEDSLLDFQDILDQLILGEMPPRKSKKPTADEKKKAIESLTEAIATSQSKRTSTGRQSVLRRLNRQEYLNTIRDLFGIKMLMFDPTTKFPRDQTVDHLDNLGDTLVTSGYLLQQYLYSADQVIEKVFTANHEVVEQTWNFKNHFKQQPEVDSAHEKAFKNRYLCLYECPNSERPEGAIGPLLKFHEGVPSDGLYEVRVHVEAKNRINPYDAKIMGVDPEEPLRLGIVPGNTKFGPMHVGQPFQPVLAETIVPDGEPEWYTFKIWLDQGYSPRFIFPNGMLNIRNNYAKLVNRYRDLLPNEGRNVNGIVGNRIALFSHGYLPHLRIDEVEIRGPLPETPPSPQKVILGDEAIDATNIRERISSFASRAYRRPVETEELDRLFSLIEHQTAEGKSTYEAFQVGVKAILCSPAFLYLQQPELDVQDSHLSPHALASRLSYFLWSSMPDEELRELADSGEILRPKILLQQTRRMLADPKSGSFVERFLDGWLNLRSLGDMPPDRESFETYYSQNLQEAMRRETFLFTRSLVDENQSILFFLRADYSYMNRPLAKLYGVADQIKIEEGHRFHRIRFTDPNRGGLLGQGSILTVTANGIETSPVIRGVWLLDNILGTPPSPPPEDVPAIDPDIRGASSMREILTKHRESPACFECHQKIDPLGFALENFDPIGRWRVKYESGIEIDSAGVLPSGESFQDLAGLKAILVQRHTFFARMLTEKLLAYACGRRIEPLDRAAVQEIFQPLEETGYPLRSLIERVVTSNLFRSK